MAESAHQPRIPDKESVEEQLDRVTSCAEFDTCKRSVDFLRFVVTEALAGRSEGISQHAIANSVFGRNESFDPTTDPIVRMQAGRVRRSLEHYYLTAGAADPILIDIPKGSYVPTFEIRDSVPQTGPRVARPDAWPTLLVSPLRNLTGREEVEFIAEGLVSDLAAELSRDQALHVFRAPPAGAEKCRPGSVRFEITGTIASREDALKLNLHLIDRESGREVWAGTFSCVEGPDQGRCLEQVVQTTVAMVAEEQGFLSRHLDEETRRQPGACGGAYQAILRYLHFDVTNDPAAFVEAFAALRQAVDADPECAVCWSYLARLGGAHWSLGFPGEILPIEESVAAARRGAGLAPRDVRCRATLSYLLLLTDELDEARHEAETALKLSGMSSFWLDAVGYLLSLSGDWERGPDILRKALELNPFPRRASYGALWADGLLRGDPAAALAAAREYAPESYFWSPLMEAVALTANGQTEEAAAAAGRLLEIKPDFLEKGHWLITRYVKPPEMVEMIERSLAEAGVSLREG